MANDRASIMFVDDEEHVLFALRRLLLDEPYEIRTVCDPQVALKEILNDPPIVVVADYQMPQMLGTEFLARVKKVNTSVVRIILTGRPDIQAVLSAVNDGHVYRFILKPWDDDELKMALRAAVDYTRLFRERETLLRELDQKRATLDALEEVHPGITRLPPQSEEGAYILTPEDLPKGKT